MNKLTRISLVADMGIEETQALLDLMKLAKADRAERLRSGSGRWRPFKVKVKILTKAVIPDASGNTLRDSRESASVRS